MIYNRALCHCVLGQGRQLLVSQIHAGAPLNSLWPSVFGLAVLVKFKLYYAIPSYSRSSSSPISLSVKYFLTLRPLLLSYGELYTLSAKLAELFNLSSSSFVLAAAPRRSSRPRRTVPTIPEESAAAPETVAPDPLPALATPAMLSISQVGVTQSSAPTMTTTVTQQPSTPTLVQQIPNPPGPTMQPLYHPWQQMGPQLQPWQQMGPQQQPWQQMAPQQQLLANPMMQPYANPWQQMYQTPPQIPATFTPSVAGKCPLFSNLLQSPPYIWVWVNLLWVCNHADHASSAFHSGCLLWLAIMTHFFHASFNSQHYIASWDFIVDTRWLPLQAHQGRHNIIELRPPCLLLLPP